MYIEPLIAGLCVLWEMLVVVVVLMTGCQWSGSMNEFIFHKTLTQRSASLEWSSALAETVYERSRKRCHVVLAFNSLLWFMSLSVWMCLSSLVMWWCLLCTDWNQRSDTWQRIGERRSYRHKRRQAIAWSWWTSACVHYIWSWREREKRRWSGNTSGPVILQLKDSYNVYCTYNSNIMGSPM